MLEGIDEVLETMRIEEEPPVDDGIQAIKTFVEYESAPAFKGLEALHNTVLDIDDQLRHSNVQTEVGRMCDELQRSFETFQRNVNKLTLNLKRKKFMHSPRMTPHDMFKE